MRQVPPPDVEELLARARGGDPEARESLIGDHRQFVLQVAAAYCKRPLDWSCDEFSVALVAFNEAIDTFQPHRGVPFLAFARLVIKSRLADHFRQEQRQTRETLVGAHAPQEAFRDAWMAHADAVANRERREELEAYRGLLARYDLALPSLFKATPRHRYRRRTLIAAARSLARRPDLM
ncbi:MAG: hypothetical protein H5T97_13980, partial [Firmicutes bacterium]|nr:hypothetical protein [Bacillota bacterium]